MPRLFHHSLIFEYQLFPPELRLLFLAHLLRGMTNQVVGLFIPVFLFTQGVKLEIFQRFQFWESLGFIQQGVFFVALFFLITRLAVVISTFPLVRFMRKIGLAKSMVLGNVLLICSYYLLQLSELQQWFFVPSAICLGIGIPLYWISYYTEFSLHSYLGKIGQQVGGLYFLDKLLHAMLPLLGGSIVAFLGYDALFLFGIGFMLISSILLALMHDIHFSYKVSFQELRTWIAQPKYQHAFLGSMGKILEELAWLLWPLYLFLFLGSEQKVGYFSTIVLILSLANSYFMGWYLGKHRGRRMLMLSGTILSLLWLVRTLLVSVWAFLFVDVVDKLVNSVYAPVFDSLLLGFARGKKVFRFFVYREFLLGLLQIVFWLLLALLFMVPFAWKVVFVMGGVGMLFSLQIRKTIDDER